MKSFALQTARYVSFDKDDYMPHIGEKSATAIPLKMFRAMKLPTITLGKRLSGSPMKTWKSPKQQAQKRRQMHTAAPPRFMAKGKDGSMYEVEGVDCGDGGEHGGDEPNQPFLYRFIVPDGYCQLQDPLSSEQTGTFVQDQGDLGARAHLELRGRITAVDATMTKMREQMEWLDEEMSRLEAEKNELAQRLAEHTAAAGDQCEFSVTVRPSVGVEHLPIAEEELQELSRRAEAIAQEGLPHGGEYVVAYTGEHLYSPEAAARATASQGDGDALVVDRAEWRGWASLLQSGDRDVGVLLLRRKYMPDAGLQFQDLVLRWRRERPRGEEGGRSPVCHAGEAGLAVLRAVAGTLAPVATSKHPLGWDRIDVVGHLEKLAADEGYMHFFSKQLDPPSNRPTMCDLADAAVQHLAAVKLKATAWEEAREAKEVKAAGTEEDEFEDSMDVAAADKLERFMNDREIATGAVGDAWKQADAMVSDDGNNGLLAEKMTEWFYTETLDEDQNGLSAETEAHRMETTILLRREWGGRVGRLLAFCIDGGTLGRKLTLRDIVEQITLENSTRTPAEKATLERLLEFCVHFRAPDQAFATGKAPCYWNLGDDIHTAAKQAAVASANSNLNDMVLAKLIKLQYVRFVMSRASTASYACLLVALLRRPANTATLTLQTAREIAALACSPETLLTLANSGTVAALVRAIHVPDAEEMVLYYLGTTLARLAQASPLCRTQLSASGLPRVVVSQLLRANLRLRTVYLSLLHLCYAPPVAEARLVETA